MLALLAFAAPASAYVTTASVEAESLSVSPTVGSVVNDSKASGGRALRFTANGTASSTGTIATTLPVVRLEVRAHANQCVGSPTMTVRIDGTVRGSAITVAATAWTTYAITTSVPAGSHSVSVTFGDQRKGGGCNRNLFVDSIAFLADDPVGTCTPAFGAFEISQSALRPPPACYRPYGDPSPFNTPIGSNPVYDPDSAAEVAGLFALGTVENLLVNSYHAPAGTLAAAQQAVGDFGHPVYYSRPSDPLYTINCTDFGGACEIDGLRIRIPAYARPAGGSDHHMAIVDQSTGWEYDLWRVQNKTKIAGTLNIGFGGRTNVGTELGLNSNATAAHFGLQAGVIRGAEMAAGLIEHALFAIVQCTNGTAVYPAEVQAGVQYVTCADPTHALPMGAHLRLDMTDAEIDALPIPAWRKTVARAAAHYGLYVGDTGGGGALHLMNESGESYAAFGYTDPWITFSKAQGIPTYNWGTPDVKDDVYVYDLMSGIPWATRLRVLA